MKFVYRLIHKRKVGISTDGEKVYSTICIGFFSSVKMAKTVIEDYKKILGFQDYPNDFILEKIELNYDDYEFI